MRLGSGARLVPVCVPVPVPVPDGAMGGGSSRGGRARFGAERRRRRSGRCAGRARGRSGRRDTGRRRRRRSGRRLDMRLGVKRRLRGSAPARSRLRAGVDLGGLGESQRKPLIPETRQSGRTFPASASSSSSSAWAYETNRSVQGSLSTERNRRLTKAFETSFPSEISPIQSSNALPPNI